MNVQTPKAWQSLPPAQRKRIEQYAIQIADKQIEKNCRIMLDLYMKMVCKTLHDVFGFGERRLYLLLGNHKRLFLEKAQMVKDGTQIEYLNAEMKKIFRKSGFPDDWMAGLLGAIDHE